MLSLGLYLKGPYLSLQNEKENFCVVFTYSRVVIKSRGPGIFPGY